MRRREATTWLLVASTAACLLAASGHARPADDVISVTGGPSGDTTSREATFTFAPSGRVQYDYATCSLDGGSESRCVSPVGYTSLALGAHRFLVRAYSSRGGLLGSDTRSWRVVEAPPPPPPPPSEPPPPPPPPPGPTGPALVVAPLVVAPGAAVGLDASGSGGGAAGFAFDLDGNGSYETSCPSGKASAVYTQPGAKSVGVQAVYPNGSKAAATQTFTVAGNAAAPPPGAAGKTPPIGTSTGSCQQGSPDDFLKPLLCPRTVIVGVAEATPASSSPDACFEWTKPGAPLPGAHTRYVLKGAGAAIVNGIVLVGGGGKVIVDATSKRVLAPDAKAWSRLHSTASSINTNSAYAPVSWNVASAGTVGAFSVRFPSSFLGLDVPASTRPLAFNEKKEATVPLSVTLPSPFSSIVSLPFVVRSTATDGVVVQNFVASIGNVGLGPFKLTGIKVAYEHQSGKDVWTSAFGLGYDGVEGGGELRVEGCCLKFLKLFLKKDNPGIPITCCAYLTYLSGEYGSSTLKADAVISVGPSIGTPWGTYRLASLDPLTMKFFLGSTFLATAQGDIKIVGKKVGLAQVSLGQSSFVFVGTFNVSLLFIKTGLVIAGGVYANGSWYAGGAGSLCIDTEVKEFCAGGALAISSKGVSGCITVVGGVGGYIRWSGSFGIFWECSWGKVKKESGAPTALFSPDAVTALGARVPAGATRRLFRIGGRGAPPRVVLTGPDGRRIDATVPYSQSQSHLVLQVPKEDATYVAVIRPAAGTWRITAAPGSPALTGISSAGPLPDRLVRGAIRSSGSARILDYRLATTEGQTVRLVERGRGVDQLVGVARKRTGSIRFLPAEAAARARRIEAIVESDGLTVRREVVARYRTPPLRPLPAPLLAATRRGSSVVARWLPVAGARGYRALVTPADGGTRSFELRALRTSVRVGGIGPLAAVRISVRAVSRGGRLGRAAGKRLAAQPPVRIASADRRAVAVRCVAAADGACAVAVGFRGKRIAGGSLRLAYGRTGLVRARLTPAGRRLVRGSQRPVVAVAVTAPGKPMTTIRVALSPR